MFTKNVRYNDRQELRLFDEGQAIEQAELEAKIQRRAGVYYSRVPRVISVKNGNITMQLVKGENLSFYLMRGLNSTRCWNLVQKVEAALTALHGGGILHGDPKPENFMMDQGSNLWIIDFGCASELETVEESTTEMMIIRNFIVSLCYSLSKTADPNWFRQHETSMQRVMKTTRRARVAHYPGTNSWM
jgi:Kae1-associated kinase Bud32